jgi:hypothetical protein
LSQLLRHVLYGVSNLDPLSYSAAIGLLVAIAAIAALVPASRALRIDPMRALRHEHKILLSGRPLRTGITTASDAGICVAGCSCQVLCKAIVLTEQINSRIMAGGGSVTPGGLFQRRSHVSGAGRGYCVVEKAGERAVAPDRPFWRTAPSSSVPFLFHPVQN